MPFCLKSGRIRLRAAFTLTLHVSSSCWSRTTYPLRPRASLAVEAALGYSEVGTPELLIAEGKHSEWVAFAIVLEIQSQQRLFLYRYRPD